MRLSHSSQQPAAPPDDRIVAALQHVSAIRLRRRVERLSYPRHADENPQANRRAARQIADELSGLNFKIRFAGEHRNVVALPQNPANKELILVGAHYDSVPQTPGADDNASAVAALLECARIVAELKITNICFVAFNREEDGLLGSRDFVQNFLREEQLQISGAHILEMIGFCSHAENSQKVPPQLLLRLPSTGDFLGVVGDTSSKSLLRAALRNTATYVPALPLLGLEVIAGMEKLLPVLARSDHAPFWDAGIPALMWTDTSEFRNPHYHLPSDTPETLDYEFLRGVTQVLLACLLTSA